MLFLFAIFQGHLSLLLPVLLINVQHLLSISRHPVADHLDFDPDSGSVLVAVVVDLDLDFLAVLYFVGLAYPFPCLYPALAYSYLDFAVVAGLVLVVAVVFVEQDKDYVWHPGF